MGNYSAKEKKQTIQIPDGEIKSDLDHTAMQKDTETSSTLPPAVTSGEKAKRRKSSTPSPSSPTKGAIETLQRELRMLLQSDSTKEGFKVEIEDDNIFKWNISLFGFDKELQISKDLERYKEVKGHDDVLLEVAFPNHYPASPPFIRVVYPRFHQYTGHITIGGSVCIKDLTIAGWNSKNQLSPFFVMIRNLLIEGHALVDMDNMSEYSETEAREAFDRVAKAHGWIT
eukprot:TRINITY_DN17791_c0_g1_i1.p1 TRINITY_DN17791_c0_g1~~TRINITY_DN17791_c0_g1_i1.p1  ORF type:complete len:228 (+),score=44.42 TRINITY_DN17791_c0_g1_i1:42-725(+)